jgi:hypothetical protein
LLGQNADVPGIQALKAQRNDGPMGILTRKQGTGFVIGSDRCMSDAPTNRPPKIRPADSLAVWTGEVWSIVTTEALSFDTLDAADEYVRANFSKVSGQTTPTKSAGARKRRPPPPPAASGPVSPVEALTPIATATEAS